MVMIESIPTQCVSRQFKIPQFVCLGFIFWPEAHPAQQQGFTQLWILFPVVCPPQSSISSPQTVPPQAIGGGLWIYLTHFIL